MIAADIADFRAALPEGGRLLGLDVGTKTIGTALCDAGWTIATAAALIRRSKFARDLAALKALVEAQRVAGIVVGLPLNMDGGDSPRTQSVRAFARNLAPLGLPILLWDERWSTQAVTRTLIDADTSRARRAALVEKLRFLEQEGHALAPAALGFVLAHRAISSVIPGMKSLAQLEQNLAASSVDLSPSTIDRLHALYEKELEGAPLPW